MIKNINDWDPQASIHKGQNVWVIKPCGLSRGRGVKYFTELEELLPYVACS
jgi:tubulin monoglycylase TTLL3/8